MSSYSSFRPHPKAKGNTRPPTHFWHRKDCQHILELHVDHILQRLHLNQLKPVFERIQNANGRQLVYPYQETSTETFHAGCRGHSTCQACSKLYEILKGTVTMRSHHVELPASSPIIIHRRKHQNNLQRQQRRSSDAQNRQGRDDPLPSRWHSKTTALTANFILQYRKSSQ